MAWTQKSVRNFLVATETLTFPNAASTTTYTSTIDFIPEGKGFTVIGNLTATNTTNDFDIDVFVSHDDSTYALLVANLITTLDTSTETARYTPALTAAHGEAPYYRLGCVHAGNQAVETVQMAVIVESGNDL